MENQKSLLERNIKTSGMYASILSVILLHYYVDNFITSTIYFFTFTILSVIFLLFLIAIPKMNSDPEFLKNVLKREREFKNTEVNYLGIVGSILVLYTLLSFNFAFSFFLWTSLNVALYQYKSQLKKYNI